MYEQGTDGPHEADMWANARRLAAMSHQGSEAAGPAAGGAPPADDSEAAKWARYGAFARGARNRSEVIEVPPIGPTVTGQEMMALAGSLEGKATPLDNTFDGGDVVRGVLDVAKLRLNHLDENALARLGQDSFDTRLQRSPLTRMRQILEPSAQPTTYVPSAVSVGQTIDRMLPMLAPQEHGYNVTFAQLNAMIVPSLQVLAAVACDESMPIGPELQRLLNVLRG